MSIRRWSAVMLFVALCSPPGAVAQNPTPPDGSRVLRPRDGDVIVIENADRVKVMRRRYGVVRAVYDAARRWVVLVVDYAPAAGGAGDGVADFTFNFREITGEWPLGERWEGAATLDQYELFGEGNRGYGLGTPFGLIQLFSPNTLKLFDDASAIARLTYHGAGSSMARGSFDQAEQREVENVGRDRSGGPRIGVSPSGSPISSRMGFGIVPSDGPRRVGGSIKPPQKVKDVPPVYPDEARRAGVHGMVILEVVIGVDGRVTDARVLRTIPLLEAAAVNAVKQWVYEPTLVDGQAVPVSVTVTVVFPHP